MNTVKTSLRSLAAEKGLDFVTDVQPDMPLACGDGKRITQCLMNLAGNALKFTREGRVEIGVALRAATLLYRVSDTGIGIAPDEQALVFEEFRQAGLVSSQKHEGTGLGLALCRRFVELHGGRIWVESEVRQGLDLLLLDPAARGAGGPA